MTTLEEVKAKHEGIMKAVNGTISVLAPCFIPYGNKFSLEISRFNLDRLIRHSDILANNHCQVTVENVEERPGKYAEVINIQGQNFKYTFAPKEIHNIKTQLEKSFKQIETFTKQAEKNHSVNNKLTNVNKIDSKPSSDIEVKQYICDSVKPIDELKTVNFQIEGKYIDKIFSGAKVEDYRAISDYNVKMLCDKVAASEISEGEQYLTLDKKVCFRPKKDLTHVRFFNGYKKDRKELLCELIAIEINKYINEIPDGIKAGTVCFAVKIGQIVEHKNFTQ